MVLFYDGGPDSSLRKNSTSMRRSIASGSFSIRSASAVSSGFTEIRDSIFDCGELIFFFKTKGIEFSVWQGDAGMRPLVRFFCS